MNGAFAVGGTVGAGNVPISVLGCLLREGRPGKPTPVPLVVDVVCPRGGRDTGEFVVWLVVRVFVFTEVTVAGAVGVVRWVFALVGWVLALVLVLVVCVFAPVVVCCAKTSPERREMANTVERRNERFSERREDPIMTVDIAGEDGERMYEKIVREWALEADGDVVSSLSCACAWQQFVVCGVDQSTTAATIRSRADLLTGC
jgi:hypothetical protein